VGRRKPFLFTEFFPSGVSRSHFKELPNEVKAQGMKEWFHSNFIDPAHETPYETREGGYQYIWGGPFDASEQIWEKFSGLVSEKLIKQVVAQVEQDGIYDWAPHSTGDFHSGRDDYFLEEEREVDKDAEELDYLTTEDGDYILTENGERIIVGPSDPSEGRQTTSSKLPSPGSIPWAGRPDRSHICVSTLGVGGGVVGVTAVFIPYKGNFGRTPDTIAEFLGWKRAENLGEGKEALKSVIKILGQELWRLGTPAEGLEDFLKQVQSEPWITISASPLDNAPLPADATAVVRHPNKPRLFALATVGGLLIFLAGAIVSGPVGDIGKGFISEATGIENFEEFGRDLWKDTEEMWEEVWKVVAIIPSDDGKGALAEQPRTALKPETD